MSVSTNRRVPSELILLIGILLISANLRAPFTGVPPLLGAIQQELGLSTFATGAITTLPLLAFAILSPVSATFARLYGLERSLLGALIAIAVGILLRSVGTSWGLYLGTTVLGMGIAVGNVLLPSIVKRNFPQNVASITGAYALSMGIAAAIGSAVAIPIANAWGWRIALLAFLVFPIAAIVAWLMQGKERPAPQTQASAPLKTQELWRSPLAWQITLFLGLNSTIYYIIVGWLPNILTDAGLTPAEAGSMHGAMQLATAIPGLLIGPLLRYLPDQRLAALSMCMLSVAALAGLLVAPQMALIWAVMFGIGTGACIILGLSFVGLRTRNAQQAAALSGMSQCIGYLLASVGPMAIGAMHDALGGWNSSLILCIALALIATVMGMQAGRDRSL